MTHIKDEQVRLFIVFGDIRGFGTWLRRANSAEEYRPFINLFKKELDSFKKQYDYLLKRNGDGFMAVKEMKKSHNCKEAVNLLTNFLMLAESINGIIDSTSYPRPEGFRVRVVAGHALKLMLNTCDSFYHSSKCTRCEHFKKEKGVDFVGYMPDLCFRMLAIKKEEPMMVHQSVKELMNPEQIRQAGFVFEKVSPPPPEPDGVDKDDMNLLWVLKRKGRVLHTRQAKK